MRSFVEESFEESFGSFVEVNVLTSDKSFAGIMSHKVPQQVVKNLVKGNPCDAKGGTISLKKAINSSSLAKLNRPSST